MNNLGQAASANDNIIALRKHDPSLLIKKNKQTKKPKKLQILKYSARVPYKPYTCASIATSVYRIATETYTFYGCVPVGSVIALPRSAIAIIRDHRNTHS